MPRCPVCKTVFEESPSRPMPFCSEQCRMIDLGRWLDERYGVPSEREEPDDMGDLPE